MARNSQKEKTVLLRKTSTKIVDRDGVKDLYVDKKGRGYAIDTKKLKRQKKFQKILGTITLLIIIYLIWCILKSL